MFDKEKIREESVLFKRRYLGDDSVDRKLNDFLSSHPNYSVSTLSYSCPPGTCLENLIVVFKVTEG